MINGVTKQVCGYSKCKWEGTNEDVLKAPNPFDENDLLWGCPKCLQVNTLVLACDESGCWEFATCGTPTEREYANTCYEHRP